MVGGVSTVVFNSIITSGEHVKMLIGSKVTNLSDRGSILL